MSAQHATFEAGSSNEGRATQRFPRMELLIDGEPVFVDIEFQIYKRQGEEKCGIRIGRIGIVNSVGETVLDVFAAYPRESDVVKKLPPEWRKLGVYWPDLLFENGAVAGQTVERWAARILANRPVVLHGGSNDIKAFYFERDVWSRCTSIGDTQHVYGKRKLSHLADEILCRQIQVSEHGPVEDADATRELWQRVHSYNKAPKSPNSGAADDWCGSSRLRKSHAEQERQCQEEGEVGSPRCRSCWFSTVKEYDRQKALG